MEDKGIDLFGNMEAGKQARVADTTWLFASNHVNFLTMLSAGLLMSPKGFGDKYFVDSLNNFPGWIPFFAGAVPRTVIDGSIAEAGYLLPCVAEIKLDTLSGKVAAVYDDGSCREVELPGGLAGTEIAILVPAPLPTTWIEKIIFRSKDEKKKCEGLAKNCSNIPLGEFKRTVNNKFFSKATALAWPPNASLENLDIAPDFPLAVGGMMALFYQIANKGDSATAACRIAFECGEDHGVYKSEGVFERSFRMWINSLGGAQSDEIALTLFWDIVNQIITFRSAPVVGQTFMDSVIDLLELKKGSLEETMQSHLSKLIEDLRSLSGFSDSTITELLKRHPKYFSRSLILFFLREECSDLFELKYSELNESDYLAAAILFAARDGWINLPLTLRRYLNMESAIPYRMASIAHRLSSSGLDLGPAPPRCVPLREFLEPAEKGWTIKQKDIALKLARHYKWDCLHTKISLGKGEYRLVIDGSGTHINLPGEVKSVSIEVDSSRLMEKLNETIIPCDVETKLRSSATKG
jgi:hypothetical protein